MAAADLLEKRSCLNLREGTVVPNGIKRKNSMVVLAVLLYPSKHVTSKSVKKQWKNKISIKNETALWNGK